MSKSVKLSLKVNIILLLFLFGLFAISDLFFPKDNQVQKQETTITFETKCTKLAYYKKDVQQNSFFVEENGNRLQKILDENPNDKEATDLGLEWLEYWKVNSLNYRKIGNYWTHHWQGHKMSPSPSLSSDLYLCKEKGNKLDELLERTDALFKKYGFIFYNDNITAILAK